MKAPTIKLSQRGLSGAKLGAPLEKMLSLGSLMKAKKAPLPSLRKEASLGLKFRNK